MKIAQVNLQSDWGGAEKHVLLLARGLRDIGDEVRLCCHPRGSLRREAIAVGISTHCVTALTQIDITAAIRLAAGLSRFRPQILHLHTPKDYFCGALAARLLKPCRTVLTRHMLLPIKPLMRRIYSRADAVFCLSNELYESLQQHIPIERLRRVRSGIDVGEFDKARTNGSRAALRKAWEIADGCVAIGLVGRLVPGKGHDFLLKAAATLIKEGSPGKYIFAGAGPERTALETLVLQAGMKDRVLFLGHCAQIPAIMAALDISVLASDNELLPLTVLEAMASSLPVVAADVGGVSGVVQDGVTGFLIPPRNEVKMVEALKRLISDPALRATMGGEGRRRVAQEFDLSGMLADTRQIYHSLLSAHHC